MESLRCHQPVHPLIQSPCSPSGFIEQNRLCLGCGDEGWEHGGGWVARLLQVGSWRISPLWNLPSSSQSMLFTDLWPALIPRRPNVFWCACLREAGREDGGGGVLLLFNFFWSVFVYLCVCVYAHVYVCVCAHTLVFLSVCVCMCMHTVWYVLLCVCTHMGACVRAHV